MSGYFFSDKELATLRAVVQPSLKDDVLIQHRVVTQNEYGDDLVSYEGTTIVKGWFYSSPTPMQEVDSGAIVTVNTYRLFVPIGTDIRAGDQVVLNGHPYAVSDTTYESTWTVMIRCSLRGRE